MPQRIFRQRLIFVGTLVLLLVFTGLFPPPKQALAQASVILDPSSGLPATTVHVTGSGWIPGQKVTVSWDGQPAISTPPDWWLVSNTGTLNYVYILVPFTATIGSHTISVVDLPPSGSPRNSAQVTFTVTSPDSAWVGNDSVGRSVGIVVKDSYVTRIQFRSADSYDIETCDNAPITNNQFICISPGGTTITGDFTSSTQASGTYSYPGGNITWTATKIFSSEPGPITVTAIADELNNNGNCSLREAIRASNLNMPVDACPAGSSNTPDLIDLSPGTYTLSITGPGEDAAATGDLDITDNLTILGGADGTRIIDGGHLDRVFHIIGSVTVDITGVTISNGQTRSSEDGGGIYNAGGTVTLHNSVVRDNQGQGHGGGIANSSNGDLSATNSLISNNNAHLGGGGVYNLGRVHLTNSTIDSNQDGSQGGGVHNSGGTVTLYYSMVIGNSSFFGGGIINRDAGSAQLINSAVVNNTAIDGGGGGIVSQSGSLDLHNVSSPKSLVRRA